jgi:peroxiredoxin
VAPVSRIACVAVAFVSIACGGSLGGTSPAEPSAAADSSGLLGNPAPDFRVDALQGSRGAVSLRALRGNVVVLDFWGTYCGPCKVSFPKLQGLHAKYSASGLHVVGISEDEPDDRDKISTFAATYGAKFAIAWDRDKTIARIYKPETMPSTFVIDRKGVVRYAHVGFRDGDEVQIEREVQELLAH